ncbi:hypothetical protein ACEUAG_14605 [Aeromonas hydrophila]|uniref:hypothetical protein n=1 Tax=Aeromonas hydrophila TaxID=644 RepID=UPI0038D0FA8E
MNNSTAEQAIRKVANSLINTHRPQLGACHSVAVEYSLEALAELADEMSLLDIYADLTKRLEILRGGQRPPVMSLYSSITKYVGGMPFLRMFITYAEANPQEAEEWLVTDAKACFRWQDDEQGLVFMPPEVEVEQLADGDLPFMDGPHIIGVDMASGPDSTAVFQPPFAHALKGGAQ